MSKPVANHPTDAVDAALADYMRRVDAGQQVEQESFIAEYPQLAEELREFLESAQIVERMAGPPLASTLKNGNKAAETHVPSVGDSVSEKPDRPTRTIDENALPVDFGRYRIKEQLGRGAMGAVYLATDTQLDREVALKLPTFDTSGGGEMVTRFYREARAVANLRHAGICPIFDVGKIDDTLYISMAYIEGKPLSALVNIDKPLPLRSVASLVRKMALALDHAHGQGVIHRDLKPANVMIDGKRQPLIMDFGLARRVDKDDQTRLTQDGMILGTPAYMSPEQVQGQLETGKQSDVYSLGVILYELLTGDLPYKGTIAAVIGQIMTSDPPAPSAKRPDVDANLDVICQQMMARNTEDRYAGMKAAADALTGYLKGQASGRRKPADSSSKEEARALHVTIKANKPPDANLKATTTGNTPAIAPRHDGMLSQWTAPWRQLPPRTKVIATSALAGLLLVMMGVVIMLRTPYGTLRIEVDDPNVTVEINKQTITLQNLVHQGRREEGKHRLSVLVGETPVPLGAEATVTLDGVRQKVRLTVSGVELTANEFVVQRNGKTTISIQLERIETPATGVKTVGEVAGPPIPDGPPGEVLVLRPKAGAVRGVWMSPDGERLFTTSIREGKGGSSHIWSMRDGSLVDTWMSYGLAEWLPDSNGIILERSREIHVRSVENPTKNSIWQSAHSTVISDMAITPDGRRVLMGSWDGTMTLWDLQTRKLIKTYEIGNDKARIDSVAFSDSGRTGFAYSPFSGRRICEWDLDTGELLNEFPVSVSRQRGQFSRGGHRLLSFAGKTISLVDTHTGKQIRAWEGLASAITAAAISPGGRYGMTVGEDFVVRLWDLEKAKLLHQFSGHTKYLHALQITNDVRFAVSASDDGTARVWRLPKLEEPPLGPAGIPQPYEWPADAPPPAIAPFDAQQAKKHQQAWADYLGLPVEKTVDLGGGTKMSFMLIPPGEFLMGSTAEVQADFTKKLESVKETYHGKYEINSIAYEGPQHRVRITKPFWLSRHETTRGQFRQFVQETGYKTEAEQKGDAEGRQVGEKRKQDTKPGWNGDRVQNGEGGFTQTDEHPVVLLSWNDSMAFCRWLSGKQNGGQCTLPSEAQWEYACRAGTETPWHFDDTKTQLKAYAWPTKNREDHRTHAVGQLQPNPFGLYDMYGNVWERCADWFAADYYASSVTNDPTGPPPGPRRTARGGGWNSPLTWSRSAFRGTSPARNVGSNTGFRVMASIDPKILESNRPALVPAKVPRRNSPTDAPPPAIAPFGKDQAEKTQASWARHLGVSVEKEIDIGKKSKLKMVLIPPGEFFMGSTTADRTALLNVAKTANDTFQIARIPMEGPRRRIRISKPFWLGRQEISRGQFRVFADETGYKTEAEKAVESSSKNDVEKMLATWRGDTGISQSDEDPVVNVSWNDAVAYCKWLSTKHPTARFHLPTEAQWEYACRAGTESLWHCGETDASLIDFAWFHENSRAKPHPGGQKKPNGFGLYDTYGNVWEWCADWLGPDFYSKGITNDPAGPNTGMTRIARGGGCRNASNLCRSALRNFQPPGRYLNILGFRVAATVEEFDARPASKK